LEDSKSVHRAQPEVIYISQSTEVGTVYQPKEVKELCDWAHSNNLKVVMDGARIANATASLKCSIADITCDAGVDVLIFGGTKNGLMFGEAVIFFDASLATNYRSTIKTCGMGRFDFYV
jgi:threonine aldolase